jgi:long-subunit fatty acid transport protein
MRRGEFSWGCAAAAAGLVVAFVARNAGAQTDPSQYFNPEDFSSERLYATNEFGVGSRALGLAGAYQAVSDDATALYYNPAGLAQLRRMELAFGLVHQRDTDTHGMFGVADHPKTIRTSLDHLAFAYPFPTYRGSLVTGLGLYRVRSNDLVTARRDRRSRAGAQPFQFDDQFLREQKGGLYRLTGGAAVDVLQSLSLGASLSYWRGGLDDDQYRSIVEARPDTSFDYTDRLVTSSTLNGFGFDVGLMGYWGDVGRFGLTIHSPVWMHIEGDGRLTHVERSNGNPITQSVFIDEKPKLPWSTGMGASVTLRNVLVSGELRYTPWEEIDLDLLETDPGAPLPGQDTHYGSKVGVRGGVEVLLPHLPLRLRGGYAYDPLSYDLLLGNPSEITRELRAITFGAGFLVADSFALDFAGVMGSFRREDAQFPQVFEKQTERHAYLSGAYRF